MAIVPYTSPHKPSARMRFLNYTAPIVVCLLGPPDTHVKCYMHMLPHRSVPCTGDGCEHCELPAFPYGFGYAAQGFMNGMTFQPLKTGILPVTSEALDLLIDPHHLDVVRISRQPQNKYGESSYNLLCNGKGVEFRPVNLLACLESMWAALAERDRYNVQVAGKIQRKQFGVTPVFDDDEQSA